MRTFKRLKSFFSSVKMDETQRGRKTVLHTVHGSQLHDSQMPHIRSCNVCDRSYLRCTLTSPTPHRNATAPEMDVISTLTTLTYLATGKMILCSSDELDLSQPSISKVITQTFIALS